MGLKVISRAREMLHVVETTPLTVSLVHTRNFHHKFLLLLLLSTTRLAHISSFSF